MTIVDEPIALTAILPTYNERENIPLLIEGVLKHSPVGVRVLVVDDDSPDGTWREVEQIAAREPRVHLLRRLDERGLTSAIRAGIHASTTRYVAWMDCDLSMPPEVLPLLVAHLDAGVDIAVGSRYIRGGSDPGHSPMARAFSRTINLSASALLGWRVRDYTSGFIAARRSVFDQIDLRGDYGEYCIDLLARAQWKGCKVVEAPYRCGARLAGESKTGASMKDYLTRGSKYVSTVLRLVAERATGTTR